MSNDDTRRAPKYTDAKPCPRCKGLGSRPCCPKCGRLPEFTPAEQAAATAAFRAMPHAPPPDATHEISDKGGRVTVRAIGGSK